ncbi:MAG TPA: type ISP restriction/modification enzyme [Streptosporangiaceae bacterium]|nr:type ISP restriction/modification enzyme [Streptosporangiaceae bacterium]
MAGVGGAEDQIQAPVAALVSSVARLLGLPVVTHAEVPLKALSSRPDFAVYADSAPIGYIEVKRPGKGADPTKWPAKSHDGRQWRKIQYLYNLLITDGEQWALYQNGNRVGRVGRLTGDLRYSGNLLLPDDGDFARVLSSFLREPPDPPRSLPQLVRASARLCRYLREEIIDILDYERSTTGNHPFSNLAQEWRDILFPRLTKPDQFADAYAQTVTFALLLARHAGVSFDDRSLPDIARKLGKAHALIGRALAVLTDPAAAENLVAVQSLRHVLGKVDWDQLEVADEDDNYDIHAMLYERFLAEYDPNLRRQTGSYYTPPRVARAMVSFTDQVLRARMNLPMGLASDDLIVVDPAMGSGTFLYEVLSSVAQTITNVQGEGALPQRLRRLFQCQLIGFERNVASFAVAELRLHDALKNEYSVDIPEHELRFLADTFEDPDVQELNFMQMYDELMRSRQGANRIKREVPVMVIIGNPPYLERAHTRDPAPWIEDRRDERKPTNVALRPSLDEFRLRGKLDFNLSATWVFFWRWAIWKAFEAHPNQSAGIVVLITPSSYLTSEAFAGMRSYLRRVADEGWIIDVSPEDHQPPVPTRIFPAVQQPLCIGVFTRYDDRSRQQPANIHYFNAGGQCETKLAILEGLRVDGDGWQDVPIGWKQPFRPIANPLWADCPSLGEIMPWHSTGVTPNRSWVIAPSKDTLRDRWAKLLGSNPDERDTLMKVGTKTPDSPPQPIGGFPEETTSLRVATWSEPHLVRITYRSFDRQYLIFDSRVIDRPRSDLWQTVGPKQVFVTEQHSHPIIGGPGLTFTWHVPHVDHFNSRGGRVLPLYRDAQGIIPNLAPGLLPFISATLQTSVSAEDLLAYIAAVVSHPGYTRIFKKDLTVPGIRIPLSRDAQLWAKACDIGRHVIYLHTYGTCFAIYKNEMPGLPADLAPKIISPIPSDSDNMPDSFRYDATAEALVIGDTGRIAPVPSAVWGYTVGGKAPTVVQRWIGYRLRRPRGQVPSSSLNEKNATSWTLEFNNQLLDLLRLLRGLVQLESQQDGLLAEVLSGPLISEAELRSNGLLPAPVGAAKPLRYRDQPVL